jgi:hypothetical protein
MAQKTQGEGHGKHGVSSGHKEHGVRTGNTWEEGISQGNSFLLKTVPSSEKLADLTCSVSCLDS